MKNEHLTQSEWTEQISTVEQSIPAAYLNPAHDIPGSTVDGIFVPDSTKCFVYDTLVKKGYAQHGNVLDAIENIYRLAVMPDDPEPKPKKLLGYRVKGKPGWCGKYLDGSITEGGKGWVDYRPVPVDHETAKRYLQFTDYGKIVRVVGR